MILLIQTSQKDLAKDLYHAFDLKKRKQFIHNFIIKKFRLNHRIRAPCTIVQQESKPSDRNKRERSEYCVI